MRPKLTEFVRDLSYSDLIDADGTKNRPDIRELQRNIAFFNHTQREVDMKHVSD